MTGKSHKQRKNVDLADSHLQAQQGRWLKKWSKIGLAALFIALISPFFVFYRPSSVLAAPLAPPANTWDNYNLPGATSGTPPTARSLYIAALVTTTNQLIIHSGFDNNAKSLNDTQIIDLASGTWVSATLATGSPTPPVRSSGCGVWDSNRQQLLVFGGQQYPANPPIPYPPTNVVWAMSFITNSTTITWTSYTVAGPSPSTGREGASCVWDPTAGKMLVYGGFDEFVYAFDPGSSGYTGSWTQLTPGTGTGTCASNTTVSPGARQYSRSVWNPVAGRMLIWGGVDQCNTFTSDPNHLYHFNDVWAFNPGGYTPNSGSWTKLTINSLVPDLRTRPAVVWDDSLKEMVIFGGTRFSDGVFLNDVWTFRQDSASSGQWSLRSPQGTAPSGRAAVSPVYVNNPVEQRQILLFGGATGSGGLNELWGLGANPTLGLRFNPASIPGSVQAGVTTTLKIDLTDLSNVSEPVTTNPGATISVNITTTSSGGGFSTDPNGPFNPTLSLPIANGASSTAQFYYRDTLTGNPILTGSAPADTSKSASLTFGTAPATASQLSFKTQPLPTTINQNVAFSTQPEVALLDQFGNIVTNAASIPISLSLQLSGGGNPPIGVLINGTTVTNTVSGVASFTGLSISKGGSTLQFVASATGFTPVTSNPFTVQCAGAQVVNSLNDDMGDTCNITLRQILTNASSGAVINFASSLLPGGNDTIPTIHLTSALPPLKTGMVVSSNCLTVTIGGVTRGKPSVAIDGAGAGTTSGFTQDAASTGGNTINGLAITGFTGYGIDLSKPGNTITCNYIGTDNGIDNGTSPPGGKANTLGGINITANAGGAGDNNIGADSPASATSGNLISGNGGPGIQASVSSGTGVKNNLFHNYIGYAADGTTRLANGTTSDIIVNNGGHIVLKQGNKVRK